MTNDALDRSMAYDSCDVPTGMSLREYGRGLAQQRKREHRKVRRDSRRYTARYLSRVVHGDRS